MPRTAAYCIGLEAPLAERRDRVGEREGEDEARQRRPDAVVRRLADSVRPPRGTDRVEPLVEREAGDPGSEHPPPRLRPGEDVGLAVAPAGGQPVGEQDPEEGYEERAE